MTRRHMSVPEAAEALGVGVKKARHLYRAGLLDGYEIPTTGPAARLHAIRIFADSVTAFQTRSRRAA